MSLDAGQPHSDPADHGGGLDAARRRFGGARADWIDLSTGINPLPFPLPFPFPKQKVFQKVTGT